MVKESRCNYLISKRARLNLSLFVIVIGIFIFIGCVASKINSKTPTQKIKYSPKSNNFSNLKDEGLSRSQKNIKKSLSSETFPDIENAPALHARAVKKIKESIGEIEKPGKNSSEASNKKLLISVEGMKVSDFIEYCFGKILNQSFMLDRSVKEINETVTFSMSKKFPTDKVLKTVLAVIQQYGVEYEKKNGVLFFTAAKTSGKNAKTKIPSKIFIDVPAEDIPQTSELISCAIPLMYLRVVDIVNIIRPFSKGSLIIMTALRPENTLIATGPARDVRKLMHLVQTFDVPFMKDRTLKLLTLTYWVPDEFIKAITPILKAVGMPVVKDKRSPGIVLIPLNFVGQILVVTRTAEEMAVFIKWKRKIDRPEAAGAIKRIFIYRPKYSKASELVEVAEKVIDFSASKIKGSTKERKVKEIGVRQLPNRKTTEKDKRKTKTGDTVSSSGKNGIKIAADDNRNLIVISATPSQYKEIVSLFVRLDVAPRQVLLEATIAELTLNDKLQFGLEWYMTKEGVGGMGHVFNTIGGLGLGKAGFTYNAIAYTGDFKLILNAFAQNKKLKVLSSPKLLVLDNQEAYIQVGQEVPIVTSESSEADLNQKSSILRNIEYRDTGVILTVTPTIFSEGMVRLKITQEVSEAQTNRISKDIDSPLILTRKVDTTVVAREGQSILLGGLISHHKDGTVNKIPLLGDIPVLGYLFKTTSTSERKIELILLITPRIVSQETDIESLSREFEDRLKWMLKDAKEVMIWHNRKTYKKEENQPKK